MPSSYTPQQKAQISQFVGFTSTKDSVAAKHLKAHGWNVEQAIDAYGLWTTLELPGHFTAVPRLWFPARKTGMLTAEEQGKIIQDDDKRLGRDWKKMKTITEQLEGMGGFGQDPDSEQAIMEELNRTDRRAPLQYSQGSVSEYDVLFGQSYFCESRARLFHAWLFQARRRSSWMKEKDLPLFYRFALHRPIMDERSFRKIMRVLNVQLETSRGNARRPYTQPLGRSRQLLFGIDVNVKDIHPSRKFRNILRSGRAEDKDRARDEAVKMALQDDEETRELVQRQLWTVYEHVQNGSVPFEMAAWHYRDAFNSPDMVDEALVICLEQFGVPTHHIQSNEGKARRDRSRSPTVSFAELCGHDVETREILTELTDYVKLYRSTSPRVDEVISMIQECLAGLNTVDADTIDDILSDLDIDEGAAAALIWEKAYDNDDESVSSSSSEVENQESHQDQEKPHRAISIPNSHLSEERDHDAPTILAVNESKSQGGSTTEDMDSQNVSKENEPKQLEASNTDQPNPIPRATLQHKLPTDGPVDEVDSRMLPPATPKPKLRSVLHATETSESQVSQELDGAPPLDRASARRTRSSPSEEGMTTGIWGILMSIKEARKIAHAMKLPQSTIDEQVRPISPPGRGRRAKRARSLVIFSKSKRKASIALHKDSRSISPKPGDHSDLFAMEGEDQDSFVLSHFDPRKQSKFTCERCQCRPCECEYEPIEYSTLNPTCSKCLQHLCVCNHISELDEATQIAPSIESLSSHDSKVKLWLETQPGLSKRSVTLLAYLARNLDDDALALLKHLEHLASDHAITAHKRNILDLLLQRSYDDKKQDTPEDERGDDDREAVRVLNSIVKSSKELTDYLIKFLCEVAEVGTSAKRADTCHDRVCGGSDLESSLLNSSPKHKPVPTPLSNPVASVAAFLNGQLSVANSRVLQAINTPLAKDDCLTSPTDAQDSSVPHLTSCSKTEDASQPSLQRVIHPDSAASDSSRAESHSGSPGGGRPSMAEVSSESPANSPLLSTTKPSDQVSHHLNATEDETDNTLGAPLMRQPHLSSEDVANSDCELPRPPSAPRPKKRKLRLNGPKLPEEQQANAQPGSVGPGLGDLPRWAPQPGIPGQAGKEWMGMCPQKALEHAKKEAFRQRKSLSFYLEERRAVRTRIQKENPFTNSNFSDNSFFQSSNGLSGSSGMGATPALNKLFDKYRDNAAEEPDKIGIEGSMRYLMDLGVKLDEVVVLAILTELGAPTMGEFTREGFVNGWQSHRAETVPKQQGQIASFRRSLSTTPDFFKRVYKQTFLIARLPGQKIVPLETALEYWRLLFTDPSLSWSTASTPWLKFWLDYLETKWKKSISKDMWDQTGVFAMKSLEDESMSWWSEDGAWPGVLDEFVFYVREKRGASAGKTDSEMDVG